MTERLKHKSKERERWSFSSLPYAAIPSVIPVLEKHSKLQFESIPAIRKDIKY